MGSLGTVTNEDMASISDAKALPVRNYINGQYKDHAAGCDTVPVTNPANGEVIAHVPVTSAQEVDEAVQIAKEAQKKWGAQTVKTRVQALFKLKQLMEGHADQIVELIRQENGKNVAEGKASLLKGIETIEWATSLPQMIAGRIFLVMFVVEAMVNGSCRVDV